MPLVDLLNHHPKGAHFRTDVTGMTVAVAQLGPDDECFVRYGGRRDVLDLALHYGYADRHTPYAFGAPLGCDVPGLGHVRIASRRLPTVHRFDPPQVTFDETGMTLSHLTCDRNHPQRLHTTLRLALLGMARKRDLSRESAERTVVCAFESICAENLVLLQDVRRATEPLKSSVPAAAMLSEAVALQAVIFSEVLLGTGRNSATTGL